MTFVHLRTHTEYSVVDGTLRIDDVTAAAAADGQPALAITDLGNLFGAVKFYFAARRRGVKPLIGADLWIEPDPTPGGDGKQPSRLLVQSSRGYLNLCELISRGWTRNVQRARRSRSAAVGGFVPAPLVMDVLRRIASALSQAPG